MKQLGKAYVDGMLDGCRRQTMHARRLTDFRWSSPTYFSSYSSSSSSSSSLTALPQDRLTPQKVCAKVKLPTAGCFRWPNDVKVAGVRDCLSKVSSRAKRRVRLTWRVARYFRGPSYSIRSIHETVVIVRHAGIF